MTRHVHAHNITVITAIWDIAGIVRNPITHAITELHQTMQGGMLTETANLPLAKLHRSISVILLHVPESLFDLTLTFTITTNRVDGTT
jgi:hypothetical protein